MTIGTDSDDDPTNGPGDTGQQADQRAARPA